VRLWRMPLRVVTSADWQESPLLGSRRCWGTAGDASPRSFEGFYRRHADPTRRALSLALGDADLGAEALDEAMTRACERWDEVGTYANPAGWAYRVGLNWARSRQRRNRWRDRRPVPERGVLAVPGDPELAAALGRLTTEHRAVVVCRYYLDWSVADTAAALDVPEGTVKSRLARALDTLQHDLEAPR
jgi:RNA polymerase sigma factor (sigma-70 family)